MPPLAADDAFLILEFVAGNRLVPHPVFTSLLASLPSVSPRTSPRLRKGLALRALDAALSDADADADALLHKARAVLADPDLASCFPQHPSLSVPDLKRLVDVEWGNLPPSTLEIAADRIAGAGALDTWANADHAKREKLRLLVGESTEREILGKLGQHTSAPLPPMAPEIDKAAANAPNTSGANEAYSAQEDDEADLVKKNGNVDHAQEDSARHQEDPVKGAPVAQLPENLVTSATVKGKDHDIPEMINNATASHVTGQFAPDNNKNHPVPGSKRSLMERNPTASTYEWDGLDDCNPERPSPKRQLPTFEKKPKPSPTFPHKTRKKWSEMQEKTLIEGVEKYGKGNWKDIKMAYPDVFEDRSTVDLKDKFRNMERHQCV